MQIILISLLFFPLSWKKRFRNTINFSGIRIYFRYSTQLIEVQWEIQFAHCAHFNKVRKRNAKLKLASKMPEKKSQYTLLLCSAFDKTFSVLHERTRFFFNSVYQTLLAKRNHLVSFVSSFYTAIFQIESNLIQFEWRALVSLHLSVI